MSNDPSAAPAAKQAKITPFIEPNHGLSGWLKSRKMPFRVAPLLLAIAFMALFYLDYRVSFGNAILHLPANLVKTAVTFCILGLGASIVISTSQIDLSSIGVATISGILFAITLSYGPASPTILSISIAASVAVSFGALSGLLVATCFMRLRAPLLIFTWALGTVYAVAAILLTPLAKKGTLANSAGIGIPTLPQQFWHFGNTGFNLALAAILLALLVLQWLNLPQRAAAIGASESSAQYAGVRKRTTYMQCFVINSILASIAGMFHTLYLGQAATTDLVGRELIPIAIAVLGGTSMAGGYVKLLPVVAAAFFWSAMRLLGPQLPSLLPALGAVQAELGQILFFSVFILVSLLFGRLLAPNVPKVLASKES